MHESTGNKVLDMIQHLIQSAEYVSPEETGVTKLYLDAEREVLLFHFNGKAVAVSVEEF